MGLTMVLQGQVGSSSTLGGWEGSFRSAARYLLSWGLQLQSAGQRLGSLQVALPWDQSTIKVHGLVSTCCCAALPYQPFKPS